MSGECPLLQVFTGSGAINFRCRAATGTATKTAAYRSLDVSHCSKTLTRSKPSESAEALHIGQSHVVHMFAFHCDLPSDWEPDKRLT
jgi:hypothetical protein